jgi:hypothetical protein
MRKGLMIAAAIACVLAPVSASATDWYRVARGQSATWYIDVDSIQRNGKWTQVREYSVYDEVSKRTGVKSAWADVEIDCSARKLRYLRFASFDADGTQSEVTESPDEGKIHDTDEGTVLANIVDFVCGGDWSRGVQVKDPESDTGAY